MLQGTRLEQVPGKLIASGKIRNSPNRPGWLFDNRPRFPLPFHFRFGNWSVRRTRYSRRWCRPAAWAPENREWGKFIAGIEVRPGWIKREDEIIVVGIGSRAIVMASDIIQIAGCKTALRLQGNKRKEENAKEEEDVFHWCKLLKMKAIARKQTPLAVLAHCAGCGSP